MDEPTSLHGLLWIIVTVEAGIIATIIPRLWLAVQKSRDQCETLAAEKVTLVEEHHREVVDLTRAYGDKINSLYEALGRVASGR